MYNNYNYQPTVNIKGRPVSSLEEVRAAQIDFDGSVFVFPDLAHNKIYTKQINLDGTASLNMYQLTDIPTPESQFITREEFYKALDELKPKEEEFKF